MRSVSRESTAGVKKLTFEPPEVILWLRLHNSTSQCLDGERHGPLRSWIRRLLDSFLELFDFDEGEER